MRKIFFLLLLICNVTYSQNWAPIGAQWHYSKGFAGSPDIGFITIESQKDTLILGKNCRKIITEDLCWNISGVQYIYNELDSVFLYNSVLNTFQLLYNINANKGDSWKIFVNNENNPHDSVLIAIDSLSEITINNKLLRKQYVTYTIWYNKDEMYSYPSEIIEYLGDLQFFFNIPKDGRLICDMSHSDGIRCYDDSYIGFYDFHIVDSCTYTYKYPISIEQIGNIKSDISISPNPFISIITMSSSQVSGYTYKMYDSKGVIVRQGSESIINTEDLKRGIYFLHVETDNKEVSTFKVVKD